MPSPYKDPTREGGWVPWLERLAPLVGRPLVAQDFTMGSSGSARTTVCLLRKGSISIPPGDWAFHRRGPLIRAVFLGDKH